MSTSQPCGACLVGSVPLADSDEVFATAAKHLGEHLKRIPDGETGARTNWIQWQVEVFQATEALELVQSPPDKYGTAKTFAKLREGFAIDDVSFASLGYAEAALESYARFVDARGRGIVPEHCRFQVSLPTPLAPMHLYITPDLAGALEPIYEAAMLKEVDQIVSAIPHADLAVQWDTAVEFGVLEGVFPTYLNNPQNDVDARLARLGKYIPSDVELGFHLCYGDAGHQHFVEPTDTEKLVTTANNIAANLDRPLNWLHLPVPKDRHDPAYFEPLGNLQLHPITELYLGLVHFSDGETGTSQRIAAAQAVLANFGIATECGFGHRPSDTVAPLMEIHAACAAPLSVKLDTDN